MDPYYFDSLLLLSRHR